MVYYRERIARELLDNQLCDVDFYYYNNATYKLISKGKLKDDIEYVYESILEDLVYEYYKSYDEKLLISSNIRSIQPDMKDIEKKAFEIDEFNHSIIHANVDYSTRLLKNVLLQIRSAVYDYQVS